jgi:hypothetical protein
MPDQVKDSPNYDKLEIYTCDFPGTGRPNKIEAVYPSQVEYKEFLMRRGFIYAGFLFAASPQAAEKYYWQNFTIKNPDGLTYWK